jgi:hypothetical protein
MRYEVQLTAPILDADCAAFTIEHHLPGAPSSLPSIVATSLGQIAFQDIANPYDSLYLYLQASGPLVTAVALIDEPLAGVTASSLLPKIVYPAGGGTTLQFQANAQKITGYDGDPIRYDELSNYGIHWSVLSRVDHFISFEMQWIELGTDQQAWEDFLDWAAAGKDFDFYPQSGSSLHTVVHTMGGRRTLVYKSPGYYTLATFVMREVIT